jgi:Ca-activated chloride channel family protein
LLEQDRPNVFTMFLGNVMPGDRVQVTLQYSELLVPTEGVYELVYPTVVGPRYGGGGSEATPAVGRAPAGFAGGEGRARALPGNHNFVATPYLREGDSPPLAFAIDVNLSTGVPLADVRCGTHDVDIQRPDMALARVSLKQTQRFPGNRDFILDYRLAGSQIQTGLLLYEDSQEKHFLLMVQPPARVAQAQIPPREYVFVLDVSGSMYGFPLDTAKTLITELIGGLRPTDTFNVVLFSGDARLMSPRSLPATQANVDDAIELIEAERGGGGTELQAALQTASAIPRNREVSRTVVVLTDGFIAAELGAFEHIAKNLDNTNVFAFGIGSSVNRYLIEGLARTGLGEPFVVIDPRQAAATALRFKRYVETPVLTNVQVSFPGFDVYDVEPAKQPDLFAERPLVVMGKWRGNKAGEVRVTGRTPGASFTAISTVKDTLSRTENAALPRLWARTRIARLSDFDIRGEDQSAAAVTALGLRYSLLTKYTSFIAVLELIRNPNGQAANVDQPQPLPKGVSELAVGGDPGYEAGAEPELWLLLAILLAALAWSFRKKQTLVGRA